MPCRTGGDRRQAAPTGLFSISPLDEVALGGRPATLVRVRDMGNPSNGQQVDDDQTLVDSGPPSMAVSIAGISTACSKDALVSSAKAVREALSTD